MTKDEYESLSEADKLLYGRIVDWVDNIHKLIQAIIEDESSPSLETRLTLNDVKEKLIGYLYNEELIRDENYSIPSSSDIRRNQGTTGQSG